MSESVLHATAVGLTDADALRVGATLLAAQPPVHLRQATDVAAARAQCDFLLCRWPSRPFEAAAVERAARRLPPLIALVDDDEAAAAARAAGAADAVTDARLAELPARLAALRPLREPADWQTRAWHEQLLQSVPGIVWEADAATFRFTFVSRQAEQLLGYPTSRWIDEPDFWPTHLHPDDRDESIRYCTIATRERRDHEFEYRMLAADGRIVWLRDLVHVVVENGAVTRLRGVMVDISAQKQAERALGDSEQRWQFALEGADDGVWDWDAAIDRVYFSRRWKEMLGYADHEIGSDLAEWRNRVHPDDLAAVFAHLQPHLDGTTPSYSSEHRLRTKDGRWKWILDRGKVVVRDAAGKPLRVIGTHSDITARKLDEQLRDEQAHVIEMIAQGAPLAATLDRLLRAFETRYEGILCSVLLLDADGRHLRHGSAPSLHADYVRAIDGVEIGPAVGSCGTAAFRRELVIVEDIATDPLWAPWREVAARHGLRSCWSIPLFDARRRVLGTFAIYQHVAAAPHAEQLHLLGAAAHTAALCIDHARAADALRVSEERFQLAMRGANDGLWDWDLRTDSLYLSPRWKTMLGYAPEELADDLATWRGLAEPHDLARVKAETDALLAGRGDTLQVEYRMRHKAGHLVDILSRAFVVRDAAGTPQRLVGTHVDISERKRAEAQLRASEARTNLIVDNAIDAFIAIDSKGRVTRWNREAERVFGHARERALGRDIAELLLVPAMRVSFHAALQHYLATGHSEVLGRRLEGQAVRADGSLFPVEYAVAALQHGGEVMFEAFVRDLTDVRKAAAERASLEEKLHHAQKLEALGTLAGGIAHDFNNVLAAILGNVELARMAAVRGESVTTSIDEIGTAARRASQLVRQILTFGRRQAAERRPIDLRPIGDECVQLLRSTLPATITLRFQCDDRLPAVAADPTQVHQVLMNLVTNAWHALDDRAGAIDVELRAVHVDAALAARHPDLRPGDYVRLSVRDDGRGMDAATLARAFEPFFTTKPAGRGTGLGLAVVHGIVRAHEGAITVTSAPGRGSAFEVWLPATTAATTSAAPARAPAPANGRGRHVLYLDDEPQLAEIGRRMLTLLGYEPTVFVHPADALAALRAAPERFDAIVTDFNMPSLNGLDFVAEVRRTRTIAPVVLSSGFLTDEARRTALELGVQQFIAKPNSMRDLDDSLRAVLED